MRLSKEGTLENTTPYIFFLRLVTGQIQTGFKNEKLSLGPWIDRTHYPRHGKPNLTTRFGHSSKIKLLL